MVHHSSTLVWKIPWTEEPGGLQSTGSLRVRHDWATSLSCIGEGNGNPRQCSYLENPRDRGAWWAAIYGVAQSRIRLKRLSSSSSPCWCKECWKEENNREGPFRLRPVLLLGFGLRKGMTLVGLKALSKEGNICKQSGGQEAAERE